MLYVIGQVRRQPSLTSFQNVMNFGLQTASDLTVMSTYPNVNSAFCFIARLRRQRLANGAQPWGGAPIGAGGHDPHF